LIVYHGDIAKIGKSALVYPKHLSSSTCDFLSSLIASDSLLALSLIESLLGKTEEFSLNDFSLLQILTNRASSFIVELTQSDDERFNKTFASTIDILAFIKSCLEWADPLLLKQYEELMSKLLDTGDPAFIKQMWSSFFNDRDPSLMKVTHDIEDKHILDKLSTEDGDLSKVEMICKLLGSEDLHDWEILFLFCFKKKINLLNYITVSFVL
jgi:hypothetical protein